MNTSPVVYCECGKFEKTDTAKLYHMNYLPKFAATLMIRNSLSSWHYLPDDLFLCIFLVTACNGMKVTPSFWLIQISLGILMIFNILMSKTCWIFLSVLCSLPYALLKFFPQDMFLVVGSRVQRLCTFLSLCLPFCRSDL